MAVKYLWMEYDEWGSDCWYDDKTDKIETRSRVIKNGLVLNICISKYGQNGFSDLEGPKHDMNKLIDLWENRFGYKMICNDFNPNILGYYVSKKDFLEKLDECRKLLRSNDNSYNYDGLIFVFSGHGYETSIVTSDSEYVSIDAIKRYFAANEIEKFKDKPKIYIFDCCRNMNGRPSLPFEDDSRLVSHGHQSIKKETSTGAIEEKEKEGNMGRFFYDECFRAMIKLVKTNILVFEKRILEKFLNMAKNNKNISFD